MRSPVAVLLVIASAAGFGPGCVADPFGLAGGTIEWQVRESEHFVYHYQADDPAAYPWHNPMELPDGSLFLPEEHTADESVAVYLEAYETWYSGLADLFGSGLDERVAVYVYSSGTQKLWLGQSASGGAIDVQRIDGGGPAVHSSTGVHSHELVHVFQSQHVDAPVVWMEGQAVALGDGWVELIGEGPYFSRSQRPNLPLAGVEGHGIPYIEGETTAGLVFFPVHRIAAMVLGMPDPEYELLPEHVHPDMRPSSMTSAGSTLTVEFALPYALGGSLVHYLVLTHGWERYIEVLGRLGTTTMAGEDTGSVFRDVYGVELEQIEDEWLSFLESQPSEFWDAPVSVIPLPEGS